MTYSISASRVFPGSVEEVFAAVLPAPLEAAFKHWSGPIPPVRDTEIRGADQHWHRVGQQRVVNLVGPGRFLETMTSVESPGSFGYQLTEIRGPMALIIARVDGLWTFTSHRDGTEVTWAWQVTEHGPLGRLLAAPLRFFWRRYAAASLDSLAGVIAR